MAGGAVGEQDVPGEDHAEPLAVQADRAVRVTRSVHHLEGDVGHLEDPAVGHLDLRGVVGVLLPPQLPVPRVQRHRRLVPLGHLQGRGDLVGVAVRADDRDDLAISHRVEHRGRVTTRIDDDDLVAVADDPGVNPAGARRHQFDPCGHRGSSFPDSNGPWTFLPQCPHHWARTAVPAPLGPHHWARTTGPAPLGRHHRARTTGPAPQGPHPNGRPYAVWVKAIAEFATSWTAMAASSRPATRVTSSTPLSVRSRCTSGAKRIGSQTATATAAMAAASTKPSATPWTR